MSNNNFPMGIQFVLDTDAPDAERISCANRSEIQTECPFCGRTKLYINTVKNTFYCQHCRASGGMLALHIAYTGLPDTQTALKDLSARFKEIPEEERKKIVSEVKKPVTVECKAAPIERRDLCYRRLIQNCVLSADDRADLHSRGLSDEAIQKFGIVSVPLFLNTIAEKTISDGSDLSFRVADLVKHGSTIPGIYPSEGKAMFVKLNPGILIPVFTRNGKISMFQIRYHSPKPITEDLSQREKAYREYRLKKFHKYAQLSSGYLEKGCSTSGIEKTHYVGFDFNGKQTPEEVCITEGCLKADVASYLEGGKAYLAILGVNNTNQLAGEMKYLSESGTKKLRIRYDMDFISNDAVQLAIYQTNLMAQQLGYKSVIYKPYRADKEWLSEYEVWKKLMNGQIGNKKYDPLHYTVVLRKGDIDQSEKCCLNDIWKASIGKGIDDFLKNR